MIDWVANALAAWSARSYPLILQMYPPAFRREFGESMTQVFRDLVRKARQEASLAGLAALWVRTIIDVLVSVVNAYASERRESMSRVVVAMGALYVCTLVLAAGYGAMRFGEFYEPPAFSSFGAATPVDEDALIAAYERALTGEFGRYRTFTFGTGLVLAVLLGVTSALFGLWQGTVWHGAGAFLAGTALTVAAVSLLPTIWFPLDRYPVGFVWLLRCFPIAAGVWLSMTAIGWFGPGRARFTAA